MKQKELRRIWEELTGPQRKGKGDEGRCEGGTESEGKETGREEEGKTGLRSKGIKRG